MARSRKPGKGQDGLFPSPQRTPRAPKAPAANGESTRLAPHHEQLSTTPILQAHQFIEQHYSGEARGATMEAKSGRVFKDGEHGYIVGGAPDAKGHPIPSVDVPAGSWGVDDVMSHRERVLSQAADPDSVTLGSWDSKGKTSFDASTIYHDRRHAVFAGEQRNQIAIWDNGKSEEIPTGGDGTPVRPKPGKPSHFQGEQFSAHLDGMLARSAQMEASRKSEATRRDARGLRRLNTDSDPRAPKGMLFRAMDANIKAGR